MLQENRGASWGPAIEIPCCICSAGPAGMARRMETLSPGPSLLGTLILFLLIFCLVQFSAGSDVLGCFAS